MVKNSSINRVCACWSATKTLIHWINSCSEKQSRVRTYQNKYNLFLSTRIIYVVDSFNKSVSDKNNFIQNVFKCYISFIAMFYI